MTAASNSEARKREAEKTQQAAHDAQGIAQEPASPSAAPESTDDVNGAQIANPRTAEIHALLEAVLDDEYGDQGWNDLGSLRRIARLLNARFAAIVREHRAEVLHEAVRRIATSVPVNFELRPDGSEDPTAAAYIEGLHDAWAIVRDYRQENDHA